MKRIKIGILLTLIIVGGIVLISLWINLKERDVSKTKESSSKISGGGADMRMEKIHFVEDKHGQKTWELEADSVQQYQNQDLILLEDVKVTFYSKGEGTFSLTGKRGKIYQNSKNMELEGEVILTSSEGYRLKTHSISYNHLEKSVKSSDPVEIEGGQIQIAGIGMLVNMEKKTFKILRQVRTHLKGRKKA